MYYINLRFFTTMEGYADLKANSAKIMAIDGALIISCLACLLFYCLMTKKENSI